MTIIRSFYFRNQDEVVAVKNFIAQLRANMPHTMSEPKQIVGKQTITPMLPDFVEDVLCGGSFPNKEDCTRSESAILYDQRFMVYYKAFMQSKDEKTRDMLRASIHLLINEILEDCFEKDRK